MSGKKLFFIAVLIIISVHLWPDGSPGSHFNTADAVVVLTGRDDVRLREGIELMRELSAACLVIPWNRQISWEAFKKKYAVSDILTPDSIIYGRPDDQDARIIATYGGTYLEALKTREICKRFGWRKLVITTEGYHIPRAKLTFNRVFDGAGVELDFRPSRFDPYRNLPFWRRWFRKEVMNEIPKLVYGFVIY